MIGPPRRQGEYPDREIDCQEAMEPGRRSSTDAGGWMDARGDHALAAPACRRRQHDAKENAKVEAQIAIARAMMRAGRPL